MDRFLYGYFLPTAAAFLLVAAGVYFFVESVPLLLDVARGAAVVEQPEIAVGQQVFKDVLQTVLAVAALAIAAFGYGTYKILSWHIEERIRRNSDIQYRLTMAYHKTSLAFVYWRLYENAEEKSPTARVYLDVAIDHTRWAFDEHVADLNQDDSKVEPLICDIRNNLAYYLSERHAKFGPVTPKERAECLSFTHWLEDRIQKYPHRAYILQDTIDTVRARFSAYQTRKSRFSP